VHGLETYIVPGNALTIGIVIGIMTLLFFFQQFGTKIVGSAFGPIMFIWFSMIMFFGIIQVLHFPNIVAALNPYYAIHLLVHYPKGFWLLGAVFLCTTGAEALYSDLGHCGKKNIQVSWIFVKIALVANYFGQAAWLLNSGKTYLGSLNPFYEIMPHWFLITAIIIATLATIIASQALISGSFTLISEAVSMNFWPRITIKYPTDVRGQIYIPSINWILYGGCVAMMLYFKDSASMVVAYGFSITVAMIMTTTLMFYYMKFVRKWHPLVIALILCVFICVETSFCITNIVKLAQRWKFLIFEISLVFTMYVWFKARKITNRFLQFENIAPHFESLQELSEDTSIPKYATHLVYLTKANNKKTIESRVIDSILKKRPKRADVYWFVHINRTDEPYTMEYSVEELVADKVIRVDFNLGFRVQPRIHLFFRKVLEEKMEYFDIRGGARYGSGRGQSKEISSDIRYVIIEKILSVENEFSSRESFILRSYFAIKRMAQPDKKAFGLDMSDVEIENIPMVVAPVTNIKLKKIDSLHSVLQH
jgi:KUP system potassium uptake protein